MASKLATSWLRNKLRTTCRHLSFGRRDSLDVFLRCFISARRVQGVRGGVRARKNAPEPGSGEKDAKKLGVVVRRHNASPAPPALQNTFVG
jgi:hypothetical protein